MAKMNLGRHIMLAVCLLCAHIASAQTYVKTPLTLDAQGDSMLSVMFAMPKMSFFVDDGFLHFAPAMGMNLANGTPGQPALPTMSTLVRLPKGSTMSLVEMRSSQELELEMAPDAPPLAPITRAWAKDSEHPPYEPDSKTYTTDAFVHGEPFEVEDLGTMGRWQVFRLTVRPMAYNPVQGRLRQHNALKATLKIHKSPVATEDGRTLLVVSRSEFREGLQPFVRWKRQEGYDVAELYVDTHQRDSIKEAMRPWFVNASPLSPAPDYVLLVGDAAQIQSFYGETSLDGEGHTTDLPYADYTGDYLPEALLGRWPVNDTAELRTVVEKTLRYEQFVGIDTAQLERLMLVAGDEQASQAPLTTNSQVAYISREAKLAHPEMDTITYRNPESGSLLDSIKADIGRGASLLNYTAHCTVGGWSSPSLSIGRVEEANGTQPMVYINNCCKSNSFSGTGFGEQLLRLPVGGAVGVIGATNSTLWYEDYYWAVGPKWPIDPGNSYDSLSRGAFDALVGSHPSAFTMGGLLAAGNLAVSAFGSGFDRFYWEVYCLLGDPTLQPHIGTPVQAQLRLSNGLYNGQSTIHVGGIPGSIVTAMQGDSLIGSAVLDAYGLADIPLRRTLDTLPLILTASGQRLTPRIDTFDVERSLDFGATLRQVVISDTAVSFSVENTGQYALDSLSVILMQTAADSMAGAWITPVDDSLSNLQPGEHRSIALPLLVGPAGAQPLWQGHLLLASAEREVLCEMVLRQAVPTVYPTLSLRVLGTNGREARRLTPGGTYRLEATVEGAVDTLLLSVESIPTGERATTNDNTLDFTLGDSLCAVHIEATMQLGHWSEHRDIWLEPGERTDDLENGLTLHPWQNNGRVPWTLDSTESHSGRFSLRSGVIEDGQLTQICLDVEMLHRDTIAYWVKSSTESQHDKLTVLADGIGLYPQAWGSTGWQRRSHVLAAGHHTICWRYSKDASISQGEDCIWIDDIHMPLSAWESLSAWQCQKATVGIETPSASPTLGINPNPAIGTAIIQGEAGTQVLIADALGRTMTTLTLDGTMQRLDLGTWPAGIYFATATHSGGAQTTKKLIVIKQQ